MHIFLCLLCNNENIILLFGEDFLCWRTRGWGGWDGMGKIPVKGVIVKLGHIHDVTLPVSRIKSSMPKWTTSIRKKEGCLDSIAIHDEKHSISLPVDILFVNTGPVNNVMGDGLICHFVCATNAHRLVPGYLTSKTPERQQKYTKVKKSASGFCGRFFASL